MLNEASLGTLRDQLIGTSITGTGGVAYFLRDLIGEGGQGWVYRANYDEPDGMWVVVKILRPDSVTNDTLVRFRREAEVLRLIGAQATPTPNIVRFYDHGTLRLTLPGIAPDEVELPFTVLEYVEGLTLGDVLEKTPGALSVTRVRRMMRQAVRALEIVHAQRVVHRDLKPSNIMLASQGGHDVVKVTDFGLVKLVDLKLTQTAAIAGATLGYAPPEQYEHGNERVSARTDVFSLGAILFEVLTGKAAFPYADGENPLRVITRILAGARPSLASMPNDVSPELRGHDDLIRMIDTELGRAMQPDPAQRQPSCLDLWNGIEPLLRLAEQRAGVAGGDRSGPEYELGQRHEPMKSVPEGLMRPMSYALLAPSISGAASTLRVLGGPMNGVVLRSALIGADGSVLAAGPTGLYRWAENAWSCLPSPRGLDLRALRGMIRTHDGQILLFGDRALLASLTPVGAIEPWPIPDKDMSFLGACMDDAGEVVLVGERSSRPAGVLLTLRRSQPAAPALEWTSRLRAVARMRGGNLVACGDAGALLHIDMPAHTSIVWERTGHLHSIVASPSGGAAVVGSGGHALTLSPAMVARLEGVQTTKDLNAVAVAPDGSYWAAGDEGRIMRRMGELWQRVGIGLELSSRFIAIDTTMDGMLALGDDGLVVQAPLS